MNQETNQINNPAIPEGVLTKLQKLKALEERAGTEAEAANAARRVAEICAKHNIDIGSVRLAEEESEASEGKEVSVGNRGMHQIYLANVVKRLFGVSHFVKTVYLPKRNRSGVVVGSLRASERTFFGLKANVESAVLTYRYLLASVESLLAGWKGLEDRRYSAKTSNEFRAGCAKRIYEMVVQQITTSVPPPMGESLAIVLLGNQLIQNYKTKHNIFGKLSGVKVQSGTDAWGAGYAAGAGVDVHGARTNRMLN